MSFDVLQLNVKGVPPSNNQFMGCGNTQAKNRVYSSIKKQWANMIGWSALSAGWKTSYDPFETALVKIRYFFKDNKRRDPDNYSGKFINDGLVEIGILRDDSFQCIKLDIGLGASGVGAGNERTEITIIKIGKESLNE